MGRKAQWFDAVIDLLPLLFCSATDADTSAARISSVAAVGTKRRSRVELRLRNLTVGLFGTLINPGANQADLVFGERIAFIGWWHPIILVANARHIVDERALGAVSGLD